VNTMNKLDTIIAQIDVPAHGWMNAAEDASSDLDQVIGDVENALTMWEDATAIRVYRVTLDAPAVDLTQDVIAELTDSDSETVHPALDPWGRIVAARASEAFEATRHIRQESTPGLFL